jgi:uncharacterized protein (TIGR03435 family)
MRLLALALLTLPLTAAPSFEVAIIKPHAGDIRRVSVEVRGTFVNVYAMTIREMVTFAYDLNEYQVQGGEPWISRDRWDVQASTGSVEATRPQARQMMQEFLADRFGLRVHRSSAELPAYVMTVAKSGAKLKPPTPLAPESSTFHANGAEWKNAPLDVLANPFPLHLGRPLLNRTGLTGRYDFELKFQTSPTEAIGPDGESVFTVLEEQLGLRVEPTRAQVDTLVIDQANRPSEN